MSARKGKISLAIAAASLAVVLVGGTYFTRSKPMNDRITQVREVPAQVEEPRRVWQIDKPRPVAKLEIPSEDLIKELEKDIPTQSTICLPQSSEEFRRREEDEIPTVEAGEIGAHITPLHQAQSFEEALNWTQERLKVQISQLFENIIEKRVDGSIIGPPSLQSELNTLISDLHIGPLTLRPGLKDWGEVILNTARDTVNRRSEKKLTLDEIKKLGRDIQKLVEVIKFFGSLPIVYPKIDEEGAVKIVDSFSGYINQIKDAGVDNTIPDPECVARIAQIRQWTQLGRSTLAFLIVKNPAIAEQTLGQLNPSEREKILKNSFNELFKGEKDGRKVEDFYGSLSEADGKIFLRIIDSTPLKDWTIEMKLIAEQIERSDGSTELKTRINAFLVTERVASAEEQRRKREQELRELEVTSGSDDPGIDTSN